MSQTQSIRVGASAVIVRDYAVLLIGYDFGDSSGFHYNFPGGGVETGEGLHKAVQREAWEEAGAEVEVGPLLFVTEYVPSRRNNRYGMTQKLSLFFRCALRPGSEPQQPQSPIDAQAGVYWVPLTDLPSVPLLPGIGARVQAALAQETLESDPFISDWQ
jgi:8-oxo-dGTP diphosphatase